jgi:glycosyltransferase involved in cell wall biosynthesis
VVEVDTEKIVLGVSGKPLVVVGIPAFNVEKTIARVVLEAQRHADVVVVCDDGSKDMTAEIAERLGADVVKHEQNLGYGAALQSLFKRANGLRADVLVTLDGDGQHDPSEVPNVVKPIVEDKADVVVGSRFMDKRLAYAMPWHRRAGVKLITRLTNGNSKHDKVLDAQSGFRAYSRASIENLVLFEDGMGASSEILINARKQGLRVLEVASTCSYDKSDGVKTSTHTPVRQGFDVVRSIVRLVVEDKPLAALGIPGIACLTTGALFGVWMLQIYAAEHRIVTNIALASMAFTITGFFCLSTAITLYAISRLAKRSVKAPAKEVASK